MIINNTPRVFFSVIVPNYNHGIFLRERIDSILNQSYSGFEIIILDDASTDESINIINEYINHPKVKKVIINQFNSGKQSLQWLKGINEASYEYIWIAESDDIAEPDFLKIASTCIINKSNPIIFFTDSFRMTDKKKNKNQLKYSAIKNSFFSQPYWGNDYTAKGFDEIDNYMKYVCTINNVSSCIIPKKEAIEVLKLFPHMTYYNDWLFYIMMAQKCDVVYSAKCLNWYRSHPKSHFSQPGNEIIKKKECYNILDYLFKASYITEKKKLIFFFTEQYLGFGLWKERKMLPALLGYYFKKNQKIFLLFILHLLFIKVTGKKIKYIF